MTDIAKQERFYNACFLLAYIFIILFVTLLSRETGTTRTVNIELFRSFDKSFGNYLMFRQIVLNVALFIPYGWFLLNALSINAHHKAWKAIILVITTSIIIEVLQYVTIRGWLDIDDVITNTIGGLIGIMLWRMANRTNLKRIGSIILLFAGICGCILSETLKPEPNYTSYFNFEIQSVQYNEGKLELQGSCYWYDDETTGYQLSLETDFTYKAIDVIRYKNEFTTSADIVPGKYEIKVKFDSQMKMTTGTWLTIDENIVVEYTAGDITIPKSIPSTAILKAYSKIYDTYVFEDNGYLLWLIGWPDLDVNTEVIFHITTDEPEKLPNERIQYGFDNRGFRVSKDEKYINEISPISHYRVFRKEIPKEYHIRSITVGLSTDGIITWKQGFRVFHAQ